MELTVAEQYNRDIEKIREMIANNELEVVPTEGIDGHISENQFLKQYEDQIIENWNLDEENIRVYSIGSTAFCFQGDRI